MPLEGDGDQESPPQPQEDFLDLCAKKGDTIRIFFRMSFGYASGESQRVHVVSMEVGGNTSTWRCSRNPVFAVGGFLHSAKRFPACNSVPRLGVDHKRSVKAGFSRYVRRSILLRSWKGDSKASHEQERSPQRKKVKLS